ncbi:MAG: orotate phosphoribosyltransferase [Gammaproteobacteria bacterium CG_4_10_14_0_8_um_filter_38_16]|nr:MAG: orotate phosphoribosyltransferase [Gammaproteobacteria bacterium CG_4_10_14_0_8_um_filter_38_16]PJA02940.1 MAG: orotate phosphoribosyltransferase [Gammaproteobacteria bacterium CG_4_10_14_0_2_um_filter_38_22]PJB11393.1 MAG: orotate phosphoribosyltransferase [Gammaproteobacteria bacterium CG_4_9_14_3_um_filter_38_9]
MRDFQFSFIDFLIKHDALQFGKFKLKSGRISPYFFNLGVFHTGKSLLTLGEFYAETLQKSRMHCDLLFGPAYKGIPLVTATSMVLFEKFNINMPYCFNRKETKDHGDSGNFVGAKLTGNAVMLDDVITAGTTIRETMALLENTEATLSGIIIAFDRQERGDGKLSAVQASAKKYNLPIQSIVTLSDIMQYLAKHSTLKKQLAAVEQYRKEYGI